MTDNQKTAYEWAKSHPEYRSAAAGYARELAGLVDELTAELTEMRKRVIDHMPTIDAVPVVRCRECKHGSSGVFDVNCYHPEYDLCEGVTPHEPEFFCAYGERKEDD